MLLYRIALTGLAALALASVASARSTVDPWAEAVKLRHETHRELFGTGRDCNEHAWIYHYQLRMARIPARIVTAQSTLTNMFDTHSFVEVKKNGRWVIVDPTFDGVWTLNGRFLGARDMQRALADGTWRKIQWSGPQSLVRAYYVDPRLLFRHLTYRTQDADDNWYVSRSNVARLHLLYYAQKTRPAGAVTGLVVVTGGTGGTISGHPLTQIPDGRWISPIIMPPSEHAIRALGAGARMMWVRRYQ